MASTRHAIDLISALSDELCPAAVRAWTDGDEPSYTAGFAWQFDDGVPGQVVRRFLCTVELTGHSPFNGTLKSAARK